MTLMFEQNLGTAWGAEAGPSGPTGDQRMALLGMGSWVIWFLTIPVLKALGL